MTGRRSSGLADMTVLVTGGGTGIDHACAAQLAADGAAVTICGRTETKLFVGMSSIVGPLTHPYDSYILNTPLQGGLPVR